MSLTMNWLNRSRQRVYLSRVPFYSLSIKDTVRCTSLLLSSIELIYSLSLSSIFFTNDFMMISLRSSSTFNSDFWTSNCCLSLWARLIAPNCENSRSDFSFNFLDFSSSRWLSCCLKCLAFSVLTSNSFFILTDFASKFCLSFLMGSISVFVSSFNIFILSWINW